MEREAETLADRLRIVEGRAESAERDAGGERESAERDERESAERDAVPEGRIASRASSRGVVEPEYQTLRVRRATGMRCLSNAEASRQAGVLQERLAGLQEELRRARAEGGEELARLQSIADGARTEAEALRTAKHALTEVTRGNPTRRRRQICT